MNFPITPYKIKKGILYWKHFGTKEFFHRLADRLEPEDVPYGPWFEKHQATKEQLDEQKTKQFPCMPLISIVVPAYHTPENYFRQMIESVQRQSYSKWELCIADAGANEGLQAGEKPDQTVEKIAAQYARNDARIHCQKLEKNFNIAENTNLCVKMASGDYLAFLDHDDTIEPDALYEFVKAINEKQADLMYTDEDKITSDGKKHYQPHFKPEFNPDLLRSNNYMTHFVCVKQSLAVEAGLFDPDMNGAQDYDFLFRCSEKAEHIERIPRILYHWRTSETSTADNPMSKMYAYDAGKRAIEGNLKRTGENGVVEKLPDLGFYRVHYPVEGSPLVSVIIPNKDQADALKQCIDSVLATGYPNLEIIIVENNSQERETFNYYRELSKNDKIHFIRWRKPFNYSAINNYGVRFARGDFFLFLNNDVRGTLSGDWLMEMLGVCMRKNVGAVGAKLYYPDRRVQHAGIVVGIGGIAGAMFVDLPKGRSGYLHKASIMQDMSAVTAACMMMKRKAFEEAGGFSEELAVAFNDVDLCLKVRQKGWLIVYDPFAELIHDESRTRGPEDSPEKVRRFQDEIEYMRVHWLKILKEGDPMYNPNLSLKKWNYSLRV